MASSCPLLLLACLYLLPTVSYAGAWTLEYGKVEVISTTAVEYQHGTNRLLGDDIHYHVQTLDGNNMFEYGMSDSLTLGLVPEAMITHYSIDDGISDHTNTANTIAGQLYARQRVWYNDNTVFSLQPMIGRSSTALDYYNSKHFAENDAEMRLLVGRNIPIKGINNFLDVQVAYRKYFNNGDEYHIDSTFGSRPIDPVLFMVQEFRTVPITSSTGTLSDTVDKVQLSAVIPLYGLFSLQMGVSRHWLEHESMAGNGVMMAIWMKW